MLIQTVMKHGSHRSRSQEYAPSEFQINGSSWHGGLRNEHRAVTREGKSPKPAAGSPFGFERGIIFFPYPNAPPTAAAYD